MSKTNEEIVRGFFDQVVNAKQVDHLTEYVSEAFISHTAPYVGIGVTPDDTSGDRYMIAHVIPGGPADGVLRPGDEIVRVSDDSRVWETFQQLKEGTWGLGKIDTVLHLEVLRKGQPLKLQLKRGLVPSADVPYSVLLAGFRSTLLEHWPDLQIELGQVIQQGDRISCQGTYSGTSQRYGRYAVWSFVMMYRLSNGKIVEGWGLTDELTRMKQLGFQLMVPEEELELA